MFSSRVEYLGGTKDEADYIYYNADILNSRISDVTNGVVVPDPPIKFNETRDTALIKDASKYHFSIVRFTMNGPGRNLPLMIPEIVEGPAQNNPNLTPYQCAITYTQTWNVNAPLGTVTFNIAPPMTPLIYVPETQNPVLAPVPPTPVTRQNIDTRYYWVYTYTHWVDLTNATLLAAHQALYAQFQAEWAAVPGLTAPFPYASYDAFAADNQPPQITYDPTTQLFTIYGDSDAYGERLEPFTPVPYAAPNAGPQTKPTCRLFFNTNMYNLYANFNNFYYNSTTISGLPSPVPPGYTNEILFLNKFYQNVVDYRLTPYSGIPPLGYVPIAKQKVYWATVQDFKSTDSIWSPITAIVFTSTLLPIRAEQTGAPVIIDESNLGDSAPVSKSAFQPIITDISVGLDGTGAAAYKEFITYTPTAEYRLGDFGPSKQEIRNIDVQVYWKCKLNNELYPVSIPNGGAVSFKMMFRHRDAAPGSGSLGKSGF